MDMKRDLFCLLWAHDYNTHTVKQAQDCRLDYCGIKNLTLNFMAPFYYGWGSTASRLQPLQGGSLLFTIQFPEIPGTQPYSLVVEGKKLLI